MKAAMCFWVPLAALDLFCAFATYEAGGMRVLCCLGAALCVAAAAESVHR